MFWGPHDIATVTAGRTHANRQAYWDLTSKNNPTPKFFSEATNRLGWGRGEGAYLFLRWGEGESQLGSLRIPVQWI